MQRGSGGITVGALAESGDMSGRLLLGGVGGAEHLLDGGAELGVLAPELLLGGVVDLNVGLELEVFEPAALAVLHAHLGDAEHYGGVNLALPPHGGHGAGDGSADELAETKFFIGPGEAVGVGIVVLALEHDRGLGPAVEGVLAYILAARLECGELGAG